MIEVVLPLISFTAVQPVWPFGKNRNARKPTPFISVHEPMGVFVAMVMGLQHALAMVGGIITPPLLIYRTTIPKVRSG